MQILERNEITQNDLRALIEGTASAVRVPKYYGGKAADDIAKMLLGSSLHGKYVNAPDIGRVGQAFFESQANEEARRKYETDAVKWIRELRAGLAPNLTPIDKVRLELDEVWEAGAQLATMNGRKMFVGLARTFSEGSYAEPHQDIFAWDAPDAPEASRVTKQLAVNVYLKMPEQGGGLTLWPVSFNQADYKARQIEGSYGLRKEELPAPSAEIQPQVGDLIFFNANNVHSVERIGKGTRVTWSSFIGYQGDAAPLILWS